MVRFHKEEVYAGNDGHIHGIVSVFTREDFGSLWYAMQPGECRRCVLLDRQAATVSSRERRLHFHGMPKGYRLATAGLR
jgi:hypothetical protein